MTRAPAQTVRPHSAAFTVAGLPMLAEAEFAVESYCACCFEPVRLDFVGPALTTPTEALPHIAVVGEPHTSD